MTATRCSFQQLQQPPAVAATSSSCRNLWQLSQVRLRKFVSESHFQGPSDKLGSRCHSTLVFIITWEVDKLGSDKLKRLHGKIILL